MRSRRSGYIAVKLAKQPEVVALAPAGNPIYASPEWKSQDGNSRDALLNWELSKASLDLEVLRPSDSPLREE